MANNKKTIDDIFISSKKDAENFSQNPNGPWPGPPPPEVFENPDTPSISSLSGRDVVFLEEGSFSIVTDNTAIKNVPDPIRTWSRNYWSRTEEGDKFIFLREQERQLPFLILDFQTYSGVASAPEKKEPSDMPGDQFNLEQSQETPGEQFDLEQPPVQNADEFVLVRAYSNTWDNVIDSFFEQLIGSLTSESNQWYEEHSFTACTPRSKREIELSETSARVKFAEVNPSYNFYIQEYEEKIVSQDVRETVLPNMYVMLSDILHDDENKNPENILNPAFHKLLTLDDTIRLDTSNSVLLEKKDREKIDVKDSTGQYFDQWGRQYLQTPETLEIANKYTNLLFTHSNIELLKSNGSKKEMFPMFVDIEFSTDVNTPVGNALEETGLSALMLSSLVKDASTLAKSKTFQKCAQVDFPIPDNIIRSENLAALELVKTVSTEELNMIDLFEWVEIVSSGDNTFANTNTTVEESLASFEGDSSVFMGDVSSTVKLSSDPKYVFHKSLVLAILSGKIKDLVKQNTRTYRDIMNGKLAKTETVFYRVEKRLGSSDGEVIQNIYLPNSSKIDIHQFVDTQVKYGRRYTYTIYAVELIYGTRYRYVQSWKEGKLSGLKVETEPSLKIVEIPYFSYTNTLLDSPPVAPDVEIIPYRAVNNKFKIALNSNVGSYEMKPISIEDNEIPQIQKLLAAQDKFIDEKLMYESDDQSTQYQVWRMEEHPTSYEDFAGKNSSTLITDIDPDSPQRPTSGAVIENIEPNKKYWYTFRSVDVHNNISFPTPVYQVELVDDDGSIYPDVKIVDFAPKVPKVPTKVAKRLLHILPKLAQTLVNEEKSGLEGLDSVVDKWNEDTFYLGVEEESLWGKKFKIRVTSKKTGRKVDLNIEFQHEHVKIQPETTTTLPAGTKLKTGVSIKQIAIQQTLSSKKNL
jgi:hypothetical protein